MNLKGMFGNSRIVKITPGLTFDAWQIMKLLTVALMMFLSGCALIPSQASRDEKLALVELARLHLTSSGMLSDVESRIVRTESPRVSYYFMGRPYGDYRLEWRFPAGGKIIVLGRGDVLRLENPRIIREPNQPPEPTTPSGRGSS